MFGYAAELCIDLITLTFYLIGYSCSVLFFISLCFYHRAFAKMIEHLVQKLHRNNDSDQDNEKLLCELIRFHISAKE